MGRSSTFLLACVLAFVAQAGFDACAQTQTFQAPSVRGVRLDWCRNWGTNCGQAAADLFCREMRFDRAARFAPAPGLGRTLVFGDGRLCEGPQCGGFATITCARTAVVAPQPPATGDTPGILFRAPPTQAAPPSMMVPAPPPPAVAAPPPPTIAAPPPPARPPPVLLPLPQAPVVTQPPPVLAPPPASIAVPIPRPRPEPGQPVQAVQPLQPIQPPAPGTVTAVSVAPLPAPQPAPTGPPTIKFEPLSPEQIADLLLGDIWLVAPAVEPDYYGDIANPRAGRIPVWDDETVFKWKPSNPDMAEYYELRFYNAAQAGNPVGALKVDGSRTYARPGVDTLAEILEGIGIRPGPQDDLLALLVQAIGAKTGNIFWEVAGYRGYDSSGVAADARPEDEAAPPDQAADEAGTAPESFEAEVAVSERWPLRITDRPNGFGACGRNEGQPPEFNPADIEFKNPAASAEQRVGIDHTGDEIELAGQFSLTYSPYAAHPKEVMGEPPPGNLINLNVSSYRFDNLFVDWGDGEVEELALDALDHGQYGRGSLLGLPPLRHTYRRAGSFIIRIFQVSEADVQKAHVADLGFAHDLSVRQQFAGSAGAVPRSLASGPIGYHEALAIEQAGAAGVELSATEAPNIQILQGGFPLEVANRAYVVYCKPVTLTEPKDETAFGPLKLYTVDIAFDASHALDPANPMAARVSVCDQSAQARANLTYVGKGRVTVTWKIDGLIVGGTTEHEIGPSPPRTGIEMQEGVDPRKGTWQSNWMPLEIAEAMLGDRKVTVEIKVKETVPLRTFGLLRLNRHAQADAPPVVGVPKIRFYQFVRSETPPPVKELTSAPHTLTVVESDQTKPCHMRFLVSGGAFDVYLPDPDQVTQAAENVFAGTGNLLVSFADRKDAFSVPIAFEGWQLENGTDVVSGTLSVDGIAEAKVNVSGTDVSLTALGGEAGTASGAVAATVEVKAAGGALRNADGSAKSPTWAGEQAPLAPDGDWYRDAAETGIARSLIGWSGFSIEANQVALDFSASEGDGPDNLCGGAESDWTGVRLDDAIVEPNLLNLSTLRVPVVGWVIGEVTGGNGLCGDIAVVNPVNHQPVGEGHISIKHIAASVRGGFVKNANYTMEVEVPLLGVTLGGAGKLMETAGKSASWDFTGLTGAPADLDLGPLRLQAGSYQFGSDITGWRVNTLAVLSLKAEGKPFATVTASGMRFGMNGRVHFDGSGATSGVFALGGNGKLGESPVNLKSATLTGLQTGGGRLDIKVATTMHLSEKLEAPDVDVAYLIEKTGSTVSASGPATTPFELKIAFPPGDPAMTASIKPHYVGESGVAQKTQGPMDPVRYASLARPLQGGSAPPGLELAQAQGQSSGIKFYADTNNAAVDMFGGTGPIASAFVLGYAGGSDYWMTLTNYDLGPSGTPLVPPIINLFKVGGGLGYHVNTDMFVGLGDVKSIAADTGKGMTFLAGMTAGTADHLTFTMDGQLKMTETEKVRLDFTSWLLKQPSGATGDFTGFIEYGGGSFDGRLWGGLSMLEGAVKLNADKGAVDVHFGSGGPWHIYLGRREGPKIEATLLNLGGTSGYLMLSGDGYFVGSGADINLGGSVGPFSASVKGWLETELGIEPLKPRVSGGGKGGLSIKGCAFGLCVGPTASVAVKMAALPVDVSAKACFKVDLLLKTVGACGNVHL
jgi:hypothetical protein